MPRCTGRFRRRPPAGGGGSSGGSGGGRGAGGLPPPPLGSGFTGGAWQEGGDPRGGPGEPGLAAGLGAGSVHMPRRQGKPAAVIYGRRDGGKGGGAREKEPPPRDGGEGGEGERGQAPRQLPVMGSRAPSCLAIYRAAAPLPTPGGVRNPGRPSRALRWGGGVGGEPGTCLPRANPPGPSPGMSRASRPPGGETRSRAGCAIRPGARSVSSSSVFRAGGKLKRAPPAKPRASFIPRPAASRGAGKPAPRPPRCPNFVEFFPGRSAPRRPGRSDGESRGCSAPAPPVCYCAASWVRKPSCYLIFDFISPWESGKGCAELGAARRYEGCGAGTAFWGRTGEKGVSRSARLKVALRKPCWASDGGRPLLSCE